MLNIIIHPWFLFALLSAVSLGVSELLQQKILNHKTEKFSAIESGFFVILIQLILFIPVVIILNLKINIFSYLDFKNVLLIIATGFIAWPATCFYLKSFEVKNISLSTIFSSISMVTSVFLGYLFLGESIYFLKITGFIFILSAIVLISKKSISLEKNTFYGLVGGALWGLVYTLDSRVLDFVHPFVFIFWQYLFILLVAFTFHFKMLYSKIIDTKIVKYKHIFFSAIGYLLFNILFFYSFYFGGEAGKVDGVSSFNIFIIIIFEYFFLKQKTDLVLKIISFILATVGVVLLGFY